MLDGGLRRDLVRTYMRGRWNVASIENSTRQEVWAPFGAIEEAWSRWDWKCDLG